MRTPQRQRMLVRLCLTALAAIAVLTLAAPFATTAGAASGITIRSGPCAGGGAAFCFDPESGTGTVRSQVTWTNQSGAGHTATVCTSSACPGAPASTGSNAFNVSVAATAGSSGSFTFTSPGTYYYYCTIHGYGLMHGAITVAAVTPSPSSPASSSPSPASHRTTGSPAPTAPGTGAAPGPVGALLVLVGAAMVLLALTARRR